MKMGFLKKLLPLMMGLALVAPAIPASAQRGGDIGVQMEREYGVLGTNTREGQRYNAMLDDVVYRITRALNAQEKTADFRLRSAKILGGRSEKYDRVVNAFALPDGRIYVTLGLMRMLENSRQPSDELAFVVGHEIAHVTERHAHGQAKKSLPVNILAILLGAATGSETLGQVAGVGAAAYSSKFSREDEFEADKKGLRAMYRAGYNPFAGAVMLKRLQQAGGSRNSLFAGWFSSHPSSEDRIERVQELAQKLVDGQNIERERQTRR